ncbi:hypothetical protein PR048_016250 [Dryococelus australis]|uniref:Uncharacterized protein n=1 Tax=Dryococelus australis TaxID=614101 RepID=A0ABQ9HKB9_9NEOP|nr:hypothetical protein PR048_016250 [Dryococelus australis]
MTIPPIQNIHYLLGVACRKVPELETHTTKTNIKALHRMGQQTDTWDAVMIYVLVHRFYSKMKLEWELHSSSKILPTLEKLYGLLSHKCSALELKLDNQVRLQMEIHKVYAKVYRTPLPQNVLTIRVQYAMRVIWLKTA